MKENDQNHENLKQFSSSRVLLEKTSVPHIELSLVQENSQDSRKAFPNQENYVLIQNKMQQEKNAFAVNNQSKHQEINFLTEKDNIHSQPLLDIKRIDNNYLQMNIANQYANTRNIREINRPITQINSHKQYNGPDLTQKTTQTQANSNSTLGFQILKPQMEFDQQNNPLQSRNKNNTNKYDFLNTPNHMRSSLIQLEQRSTDGTIQKLSSNHFPNSFSKGFSTDFIEPSYRESELKSFQITRSYNQTKQGNHQFLDNFRQDNNQQPRSLSQTQLKKSCSQGHYYDPSSCHLCQNSFETNRVYDATQLRQDFIRKYGKNQTFIYSQNIMIKSNIKTKNHQATEFTTNSPMNQSYTDIFKKRRSFNMYQNDLSHHQKTDVSKRSNNTFSSSSSIQRYMTEPDQYNNRDLHRNFTNLALNKQHNDISRNPSFKTNFFDSNIDKSFEKRSQSENFRNRDLDQQQLMENEAVAKFSPFQINNANQYAITNSSQFQNLWNSREKFQPNRTNKNDTNGLYDNHPLKQKFSLYSAPLTKHQEIVSKTQDLINPYDSNKFQIQYTPPVNTIDYDNIPSFRLHKDNFEGFNLQEDTSLLLNMKSNQETNRINNNLTNNKPVKEYLGVTKLSNYNSLDCHDHQSITSDHIEQSHESVYNQQLQDSASQYAYFATRKYDSGHSESPRFQQFSEY